MVLVRRKLDGKYALNKGARRSWCRRELWSLNPADCKPYANETGARWSFYHYIPTDPECKCSVRTATRPDGTTYQYRKRSPIDCAHEKARKAAIKAHFDDKYEVVAVRLEVKI